MSWKIICAKKRQKKPVALGKQVEVEQNNGGSVTGKVRIEQGKKTKMKTAQFVRFPPAKSRGQPTHTRQEASLVSPRAIRPKSRTFLTSPFGPSLGPSEPDPWFIFIFQLGLLHVQRPAKILGFFISELKLLLSYSPSLSFVNGMTKFRKLSRPTGHRMSMLRFSFLF